MQKYTASVIIPLYDQQAEWEYRLRMIHEAEHFLYASTYFLHYDQYGRAYVEALLAAQRRGVSVTLLIDVFGQKLAGSLMTKEEKAGVEKAIAAFVQQGANVIFYRCRSPFKKLLGSGMHIKIQLSDKGGAIFSSGNISATSYDKWREFSVYIEGDITARLLQEFTLLGVPVSADHLQMLRENKPKVNNEYSLGYISYNPVADAHILNPIILKNPNAITEYLVDVFSKAQVRISLTSLYFKPAPVMVKALIDAAKRGVVIEIFHSHRDALGPSILPWTPSFHLYRGLIDAGIDIYENRRGEHSKIILIDGKMVVFGSYNLEYAAHDRLAEAMMFSQDKEILAAIEEIFDCLRKSPDNIKVDETIFSALPKHIRWKAALAKPLSRWL